MKAKAFLSVLFLSSAYGKPSPDYGYASPAAPQADPQPEKKCELVRSLTKTSPECFLEPECNQKCTSGTKEECNPFNEKKCSIENENKCYVVDEEKCEINYTTEYEQKCDTINENVCSNIVENKCEIRYETVTEQKCTT